MTTGAVLDLIGWIAVRVGIGFVYLFALYKNTGNAAARQWLVEHTAYMFSSVPEPRRTRLAKICAFMGSAMMFVGGITILFGIEGRIGALLLLGFTAIGVYQHKLECDVAMNLGGKLATQVPATAKGDLTTLQWSGFSGNYSSGLKNWALCGICIAIFCWGTGPSARDRASGEPRITISDRIVPSILRFNE
jgi:hypothetical protein